MAGEKSLYRKTQVLLLYAGEADRVGENDLLDLINRRQPTNFIYAWRDKKTDEIKRRVSEKSVLYALRLCQRLKLLTVGEIRLTRTGRSATDPRRYPAVLGRQVVQLLETAGVGVDDIFKVSRRLLTHRMPVPPTSAAIWDGLACDDLDFLDFNRLLSLLSDCGVLVVTQRRLYLPI